MNTATNPLPWYGLRIRSKHEHVAATVLRGKGYEPFLPSYRVRRRWTDRIKDNELPLFPGYVFCRFDPKRTFSVLRLPSVLHVLSVGSKPAEVPDAEVETIRRLLASGRGIAPWDYLEIG